MRLAVIVNFAFAWVACYALQVEVVDCGPRFDRLASGQSESAIAHRTNKIVALFVENEREYKLDPLAGVKDLFSNRELIPENGVIHIVGPDLNFHEWMVPVLARGDIKVVVSDKLGDVERSLNEPQRFEALWRLLNKNNLSLIESSRFSGEGGKERFLRALQDQVRVSADIELSKFPDGSPIPSADLLLARLPLHSGWNFSKHLRAESVVWVTTERRDLIPASATVLEGEVAGFAPRRNDEQSSRGRSWGMELDSTRSYLWVVDGNQK